VEYYYYYYYTTTTNNNNNNQDDVNSVIVYGKVFASVHLVHLIECGPAPRDP